MLALPKSVSALTKNEISHASFQGEIISLLVSCHRRSLACKSHSDWVLWRFDKQRHPPLIIFLFEFIASQAAQAIQAVEYSIRASKNMRHGFQKMPFTGDIKNVQRTNQEFLREKNICPHDDHLSGVISTLSATGWLRWVQHC
ncbi:hypothetical protein [Undibacterium sp. Ji50W]|uniref:hypothetical protein n=1 Tax=Undibacterium sp. Ji50W TaxID=3413041 RepID=UPI003BF59658